ncbi:hypothetical protein [Pseudothermotoga thermarum]|uniref:NurA domain-containing protein n=1 Tax=Pseudothermotoga thermarum DSM 5069 TaxID=688269 RepID=F7YYA8_9THEM|nr:hypothetical protein [Pseudothermotoga thermarum]AEH50929.1 hypothetical protein Theth_0845 [Pseudothermotoga thermarum DSM 5069]
MNELGNLISKLNPRVLQIREEASFVPLDITYSSSGTFVENDKPNFIDRECENIIFVDSRRRTFESITVEGFVMLLCQVVTGALRYSNSLCTPLFSPDTNPPESKFILAVPQALAQLLGLEESQRIWIGEILAQVEIGASAENALDSYMQRAEKNEVEKYLDQAIVIKDGSIDFTTPAFRLPFGPFGLVKNIEKAYLDMKTFLSLGQMKRGERSRSIKVKLSEPDYERVMTYLKLVDSPGLKGLVRLEAVVEVDVFESSSEKIFELFDQLAKTLPNLTADASFIARMPENIFPVSYLEKCLEKFFYDRDYVHWNVVKALAQSKSSIIQK